MKIYCCCCGKQAIPKAIRNKYDRLTTTLEGAKANFGNTVFCGICAEELDENGMFPEERAQVEGLF